MSKEEKKWRGNQRERTKVGMKEMLSIIVLLARQFFIYGAMVKKNKMSNVVHWCLQYSEDYGRVEAYWVWRIVSLVKALGRWWTCLKKNKIYADNQFCLFPFIQ